MSFILSTVAGLCCDLIITVTIVYALRKARTGNPQSVIFDIHSLDVFPDFIFERSDGVLKMMVVFCINTGLLTAQVHLPIPRSSTKQQISILTIVSMILVCIYALQYYLH